MNQKIKLVILAVIIIITTVSIYGFSKVGKPSVQFVVAPHDSAIYINDKKVGDNANLSPGTYKLTVKKIGYENFNSTITVNKDKENIFLASLMPTTSISSKELEKYAKDYKKVESMSGNKAIKEGLAKEDANPIVAKLPQIDTFYRIDYSYTDNGSLVIEIKSDTSIGRYLAIQKIKDMGFRPSNYSVTVSGLTNPFINQGTN